MYKKCKVVMLPTKEDSNLYKTENVLRATWGFKPTGERFTYQYLYILSDDEIKEGDWCYSEKHKDIETVTANPVNVNNSVGYYKVIATTNQELGYGDEVGAFYQLPQPTENFVVDYAEQFNRGNIITDILVEYSLDKNESYSEFGMFHKYILKTSKDNTITIKKVKESWDREEVAILIRRAFAGVEGKYTIQEPLQVNKWIEENLT